MRKPNIKMNLKLDTKKMVFLAIFLVILLIAAAAILLASRGEQVEEPSLEQVLKDKLTAYETDLRDSLGSMETNTDVGDYLLSWAKNKQISAFRDTAGNVIYTIPSAENAPDAQPAAVLCSFDAKSMEAHVEEMAIALTIARNVQNNGKLSVIFLAEEDGEKSGVKQLNYSWFTDDTAIFCLSNSSSARVSVVTGGYQHITISKKLSYNEPSYNKAYKVTLKNCPSELITGKYDATLNPIKTLGSVLANFKSTSLLFELSSFSGGSDEMLSPSRASMTVVINEGDTEKFQRKMDNSIEKIYEKYNEEYPEIEYTYEEVELPSRVIDREYTDNLVSLMYTSFNGVYNRDDEGTITALTNIGKLSTKDRRLKIDVAIMCSDALMMHEISEAYETICGLCDVNYKISEEYPVYDGSAQVKTLELLKSYEEAFLEFTGDETMVQEDTAVLTNCTFIHERNRDLPIVFCGITDKTKHKFTGSLVTWLDQGITEEE